MISSSPNYNNFLHPTPSPPPPLTIPPPSLPDPPPPPWPPDRTPLTFATTLVIGPCFFGVWCSFMWLLCRYLLRYACNQFTIELNHLNVRWSISFDYFGSTLPLFPTALRFFPIDDLSSPHTRPKQFPKAPPFTLALPAYLRPHLCNFRSLNSRNPQRLFPLLSVQLKSPPSPFNSTVVLRPSQVLLVKRVHRSRTLAFSFIAPQMGPLEVILPPIDLLF